MLSNKQIIKKSFSLIVFLLVLISASVFAFTFEEPDLNSKYYTWDNPFYNAGYEGQCTWYAWGRAYEKTGIKFDVTSNAAEWFDRTSFPKGSEPRANSIAVWGTTQGNPYGHVAFVEYVDGDTIYFTEANVDTYRTGGGYDGRLKQMSFGKFKNRSGMGKLLGFIYLGQNQPIEDNGKQSIFYGAGSIVCPDVDNYGCNKDIAMMYPNSDNLPSTVVFQWKYDGTYCPYLKIYTYKPLYAKVGIKRWYYNKTRKAYKVRLDEEGIVISRPDENKIWFNIVVTSINPIDKPIEVYATCVNSFSGNSKERIDNFYVDVTGNYYWTGTASIMSFLYPNRTGFGINKDYVVLFNTNEISGKNSFSSVQWYVSDSCSSLRLETMCIINNRVVKANDKFDVYEVSYKGWSEDNSQWRRVSSCSSFPCTVTPDISGYIILKIKGKPQVPHCVVKLECK